MDAWKWIKTTGVVTATCSPYTVPTCAPDKEPCLPPFQPTPKCSQSCVNGDKWDSDLHYLASAYSFSGVNSMVSELVANGPIEVQFDVYEDFVTYKSGVYVHKKGQLLGGHAVKLIGYGNLNGTDYWLCCNSWTSTWGDDGLFMIAKGINECGIEEGAVAGLPKYPTSSSC